MIGPAKVRTGAPGGAFGAAGRALGCAAAALLLVAGCSKLNEDNFSRITPGMTEAAVRDILGPPTEVDSGEMVAAKTTIYRYRSLDGGASVTITFVDRAVAAKTGYF